MATGKIGALRALPANPVEKAVEYALTLIGGWQDAKRKPFEATLAELREAARHNADIYKQASEALNELSRRNKEVRDAEAQAKTATAAAIALSRTVAAEVAAARQALAHDKTAHDIAVQAFEASRDEAGRALLARENAVEKRETDADREDGRLVDWAAKTETAASEAAAIKADYLGKLAKLREIVCE